MEQLEEEFRSLSPRAEMLEERERRHRRLKARIRIGKIAASTIHDQPSAREVPVTDADSNEELLADGADMYIEQWMNHGTDESQPSPKWSLLELAAETTKTHEDRVQGAIARYLIKTSSLLEMSDEDFLFPQEQEDGTFIMVPFMDWKPAIREMIADPKLMEKMDSMRSDLTPDKWPGGGGNYDQVYAKAITSPEYKKEFTDEKGNLRPRKYLAQKLQAISNTLLDDIKKGGNSMTTLHNEILSWAETGRYGEGRSNLPARELARLYTGLSRTAEGRKKLTPLLSSPAHVEAINKALYASGFTEFNDVLGKKHKLTIQNIIESGVDAERRLQAMANNGQPIPEPAPTGLEEAI